MKILSLLFGETIALMLSVAPARSDVIWTFIETSCQSISRGGCVGLQLPSAVAQLTLPNINSSGTYSYLTPPIPPTETGTLDFTFRWGDLIEAPVRPQAGSSACFGNAISGCFWNITFASSETALLITIDFIGPLPFSFFIQNRFNETAFTISALDFMPGCGSFALCSVDGFWTLTSVPESSSLAVLAGALLVLFTFKAYFSPAVGIIAQSGRLWRFIVKGTSRWTLNPS